MKQKIFFKGLNSLRFFAAFSVLIFHSSQWYHHDFSTPFKLFLHNLPVAVDFFFILSGFLIIYLLMVEKSQIQTINLKHFYIRRFLRIFPLYYLIIILTFFIFKHDGEIIAWRDFSFFIGNFSMITKNAWTNAALNPLWSINIEEHFYFVIPFLIYVIPLKKLNYLFFMVILLSFGFRIYATVTIPNNWMTIYMHTFSQMDLLAIGGLLAWYHFYHKMEFHLPSFVYLIIFFAFLLLMSLVDSKDYSTLYFASLKKYIFTIPLIFLLLFFIFDDHKQFEFIKNNKLLNYLGKISFGIYLFNAIVIDQLEKIPWLHQHYAAKLPLDILITLLVATLSYELFEKQFLKLKGKFQVIKTNT